MSGTTCTTIPRTRILTRLHSAAAWEQDRFWSARCEDERVASTPEWQTSVPAVPAVRSVVEGDFLSRLKSDHALSNASLSLVTVVATARSGVLAVHDACVSFASTLIAGYVYVTGSHLFGESARHANYCRVPP